MKKTVINTIEFEGVTYKYVTPQDFTLRQFKIGKQMIWRLIPLIQKSEAMKSDGEIDIGKMSEIMDLMIETDEKINEVEILHLMYIPENQKKFDLEYYKKHKNDFEDMTIDEVSILKEKLPDFFTFMFQHIADGILTSTNSTVNPTTEVSTLSIAKKTD